MEKVLNNIVLNIYIQPSAAVVVSGWVAITEALRLYCHPRSTWAEVLECLKRCGFWAEALALESSLERQWGVTFIGDAPVGGKTKGAADLIYQLDVGSIDSSEAEELSPTRPIFMVETSSNSGQDRVRITGSLGAPRDTLEKVCADRSDSFHLLPLSAFGIGYPKAWVDRLGASAPPVVWGLQVSGPNDHAAQDQHALEMEPTNALWTSLKNRLSQSERVETGQIRLGNVQNIVSGVGCRQAERWALEACRDWARLLSGEGFALASGGARGCDQAFIAGAVCKDASDMGSITGSIGGSNLDSNLDPHLNLGRRRVGSCLKARKPAVDALGAKKSRAKLERIARIAASERKLNSPSTIEILPYGFMAREIEGKFADAAVANSLGQDCRASGETQNLLPLGGAEILGWDAPDSDRRLTLSCGPGIPGGERGGLEAAIGGRTSPIAPCRDLDPDLPVQLCSSVSPDMKSDHLVLSPFPIGTPFSGSNAMIRNRLIYALGDFTIVFSARFKEGGTWGGAIAALRAKRVVWILEPPEHASQSRKKAFAALVCLGAMAISRFASLEELHRMVDESRRIERAMTRTGKQHSRLTQSLFAS